METVNLKIDDQILQEKIETLIAIGAAIAANCIPCFEHLYEKAVNTGITLAEIRRTSEIAGQVKRGAHIALTNSVDEIIGEEQKQDSQCNPSIEKSCCC